MKSKSTIIKYFTSLVLFFMALESFSQSAEENNELAVLTTESEDTSKVVVKGRVGLYTAQEHVNRWGTIASGYWQLLQWQKSRNYGLGVLNANVAIGGEKRTGIAIMRPQFNHDRRAEVNKNVEVSAKSLNKRGKSEKEIIRHNDVGRQVFIQRLNHKGKEIKRHTIGLELENDLTSDQYYNRGKVRYAVNYKHDDSDNLVLQELYSNGKLKVKLSWEYKDNCLQSSSYFKKNSKKPGKRWAYEYHFGCQIKQTILFNKKDEVLGVWSYDCKDEGEKLDNDKLKEKGRSTQMKVCRWEETSDDFITKTIQMFTVEGEPIKKVLTFTRKDTAIVSISTYNKDDSITLHETYANKNITTRKNYTYDKGKLKTEKVTKFQGAHQVYMEERKYGVLIAKRSTELNTHGSPTSYMGYSKSRLGSELKLRRHIINVYNEKNLVTAHSYNYYPMRLKIFGWFTNEAYTYDDDNRLKKHFKLNRKDEALKTTEFSYKKL